MEGQIYKLVLPKDIVKDLKDGWVFELYWDSEDNIIAISEMYQQPKSQNVFNDVEVKKIISGISKTKNAKKISHEL